MDKKVYILLAVIILITVFNLSIVYYFFQNYEKPDLPNLNLPDIFPDIKQPQTDVLKFTSEDDFKNYLTKAPQETYGLGGLAQPMAPPRERAIDFGLEASDSIGLGSTEKSSAVPDRFSETNVQVMGIDEPDIIKTDGQEIYFSSHGFYAEPMPVFREIPGEEILTEPSIVPPAPRKIGGTKAIKAFPPADLQIESDIDKQGDLLLNNNILVVFSNNEIYGYDVTDPTQPVEKWSVELEQRNFLETARLYQDKIYLITRTRINFPSPCPIKPLTYNGQDLEIACTDIYHPTADIPVDTTYSILELDPQNGQINNKTAFVGASGSSVIYMSNQSIYVTYYYPGDFINYMLNFFKANNDLIPEWVTAKLSKLQTYDISDRAKMTEFMTILQQFMASLDEDELLRIENELNNKMTDYAKEHSRELEKTGVVKIAITNLDVAATGIVPGSPLNQFSLDEYQGNLRIATTTGRRSILPGFGSRGESLNDVYILDKNLKQTGSVLNLGLTEQIYSVRFIEDKGYVVTFRKIDPFYVLDLADPQKPQLKGELKIPGYSSYLHPISKDKILGIGEEDNRVKISLFDVSNPAKPSEISKYNLEEYFSEVAQTHHAFLLDDKFNIFFLPGSRGGYIFSYADNELELVKAVSNIRARRAIFINDYFYIIGDDRIIVLNETDWQEVNQLRF
ncbi:MAG: hypothetical protein GF365_00065 [Candidatus Buchananbacteria bacterium]|nr:hypothetical protein [Candidatus Buchananbacteria bacterium]